MNRLLMVRPGVTANPGRNRESPEGHPLSIPTRRWAHGRALCGLRFLYLAPALRLTGATTIRAGVGVWTTAGPYWGQVFALAIDPVTPTTVYTGTGETSRVFKSTDGGAHWADTGSPFFMGAWTPWRSIPPPRPRPSDARGEQ